MSRKEERGFAGIKDCINAVIWGLEEYTKKSKERQIVAATNSNVNIRINSKVKTKSKKKKKKIIGTSSDKLGRLYTRLPGQSKEKISRENESF